MKSLDDCDYTAFISYAHADDEAWFRWVSHFRRELERGLAATMRGTRLPPLHLSADNGPVAGALGAELRRRIERSFAMIIVVHDNYAQSEWCLKELEYFKQYFGEAGCRERLYVLALSEPAMHAVAGGPVWQRLLPGGEQLWIPFYDEADRSQPTEIYMAPELVTQRFREQFLRLRKDLVAKLKRAAGDERPPIAVMTSPVGASDDGPAGAAAAPVVESPPVADAAGVVLGFVPPGPTAAAAAALAERLRQRGVGVRQLSPDAVFDDFSAFADAALLVLPFDDEPLTMTTLAGGGHLQVQREAWLRQGRDAAGLCWLDLRAGPATPARAGAAAWVAAEGIPALTAEALLERWAPTPAPPAAADVRLYIESNRHELTLWQPLGERIRAHWQRMAGRVDPPPPLALNLRPRGLPVEQIDHFPSLDDADGVVLLWGRKSADALVAQINKVENKMSPGRDAAPGVVAYLMPPQRSSEPVPAWGWQVLRFEAARADAIDVVAEEDDDLQDFLRRVLARRLQRHAAEGRR
jgi:hypothetical protein